MMRLRTYSLFGLAAIIIILVLYNFYPVVRGTPVSDYQYLATHPTASIQPTYTRMSVISQHSSLAELSVSSVVTPTMLRQRVLHSMTLLNDGSVLVAGGIPSNGNPVATSAELYDPVQAQFTTTGEMIIPRFDHTATLLDNGNVLLAGGTQSGSDALASAELYDPVQQQFQSTSDMSTPRLAHTATLLPNGEVLIVGGNSGSPSSLNSAELYNPTTGTFTVTGSLHLGRMRHTATLLANGEVLIVGGEQLIERDGRFQSISVAQAEIYNPQSGTFRTTGALLQDHDRHSATVLLDGRVLIVGGIDWFGGGFLLTSAEVYDPQTEQFTRTGSLLSGRQDHTASLLPSGRVLIVGGTQTTSCPFSEIYDPVTNSFTYALPTSTNRFYHRAATLTNGDIVIAGGSSSVTLDTALGQAEVIREQTNSSLPREPACEYLYLPMAMKE